MAQQIINGILTTLATAITSSGQTSSIQVNAVPATFNNSSNVPINLVFFSPTTGSLVEEATFTSYTGTGPYTLVGVVRGSGASTYLVNSNVAIGVATSSVLNTQLPYANLSNPTFTSIVTAPTLNISTGINYSDKSQQTTAYVAGSKYGILYNKSSWTTGTLASDFILNASSVTSAITGTNIQLSTGSPGPWTNSLDIVNINGNSNYSTGLSKWLVEMTFVVGTIGSTTYGIGCGIRSKEVTSGNDFCVYGRVYLYTGNIGFVDISLGAASAGLTAVATSVSQLSITAGHTVYISVERNEDLITTTAYNVTTSSSPVSVSYRIPSFYNQSFYLPNTGHFCVPYSGGTQIITSLKVSSSVIIGADVAIVGESKCTGLFSDILANSFPSLLQNNFKSIVLAGGSDTTADVLNRISEIISLKPKTVLLHIGNNDVRFGSTLSPVGTPGTIEYNYASIVSQLVAAGIAVYHLLPLFETTLTTFSSLSSFIQSTYPGAFIDSGLQNYGSNLLVADGVHPNAAGHNIIYRSILASNFLPNFQFQSETLNNLIIGNTGASSNLFAQSGAVSKVVSYTPIATGAFRIGVRIKVISVTVDVVQSNHNQL